MLKEKEIENMILDYLFNFTEGHFWKVNTTGVYDPRRKVFLTNKGFRRKGVPDIIGFYRGKFVGLEVKTKARRKQATIDQKEFMNAAVENNQVCCVVTDLSEVIKILQWIRGR